MWDFCFLDAVAIDWCSLSNPGAVDIGKRASDFPILLSIVWRVFLWLDTVHSLLCGLMVAGAEYFK